MYRVKKTGNFPISRDGILYSICLIIFSGGLALFSLFYIRIAGWAIISGCISLILGIMGVFVLFFFRNPKRDSKAPIKMILSPADGKVLSITEMVEPEFIRGKAIKVSIFLSLFDVHINRSPIEGKVQYHHYREGKMLPAFKSHASDINERNTIGIESSNGYRVLVHQITGFIARRIVWWVKPGNSLNRGERFGLIKFGSCTEIIMPEGTMIKVTVGEKVRGGITVIGEK